MFFPLARWQELPMHTRLALAQQFGIHKSGSVHVIDSRIVQDGYTLQEIQNKLTPDAVREWTGSTVEDINELWDEMVAKAEGRTVTVIDDGAVEKEVETAIQPEVSVEEPVAVPNFQPKKTVSKKLGAVKTKRVYKKRK